MSDVTSLIRQIQTLLEDQAHLGVTSFIDLSKSSGAMPKKNVVEKKTEKPQNISKPSSSPKPLNVKSLEDIRAHIGDCTRCKLSSTRNNIVFGVGNKNADLVFVGEAPGRDEDEQGVPFVGRAGQLLTKIIESIGLTREEIYICNVIKCRPPENRPPEPDEIAECDPFLKAQIAQIKPKIICTLGKFAAQTLLQTETPISQLRGVFATYEGVPLMPTYHPAYLLRNPSAKKEVWEDMKKVHDQLQKLTGKKLNLKKADSSGATL